MSTPARQLTPDRKGSPPRPAPKTAPKTTRPKATPGSAPRPRPSTPPQARRRARRGHRTAFWLLAAALVSAMVMGLVAVNALSVQTTYHTHEYLQEVSDLSAQQIELTDQIAALSAPGRVAAWALANGMQVPAPGDTVVLRVPGVLAPPAPGPGNP
jgi:cell division protein FtsL